MIAAVAVASGRYSFITATANAVTPLTPDTELLHLLPQVVLIHEKNFPCSIYQSVAGL